MANRWEKVETVTDYVFLGSKFTADNDFSREIKSHLFLGRKTITNLDSVLKKKKKNKDIPLPTKVHMVKAVVFQLVMHGCESWTIKKTESQELMTLNFGAGEDS